MAGRSSGRCWIAAMEVVVFSRDTERVKSVLPEGVLAVTWSRPYLEGPWMGLLDEVNAVVNLAGAPVAEKRWTVGRKRVILESRLEATNAIVEGIRRAQPKPAVLVNGSALGYYGSRGSEVLTESSEAGDDFLAGVVKQWESAALAAREAGARVVLVRTGIVLGKGGGALPLMTLPFKFFGGGLMGDRDQFVPWVHIDDEVGIILMALDNPQASGPMNAVAPQPATMETFSRAIASALHRPMWVPALPRVMGLALGERSEVAFASQNARPERAESLGYRFVHADLDEAVRSCLSH